MKISKIKNYFKQATVIAENSHDSQTQVGCLLIDKDSGAVVSSGYNGFIRKTTADLPTTRPEKHKYIIHAEINALLNACRHGIRTDNCFAVVTLSPCVTCLRAMYQSEITTIYFRDEYRDFKSQLTMEDLSIILEDIGNYTKITLEVK